MGLDFHVIDPLLLCVKETEGSGEGPRRPAEGLPFTETKALVNGRVWSPTLNLSS